MTKDRAYLCIHEPGNAQEVALIHLLLSGTGIAYLIENESNSQWSSGVVGVADSRMRLLVEADRADEARALLARPPKDG